MSQLEKLLAKIRNNPKTVRFEELDKILKYAGFEVRQPRSGSSHFIYKKGNFSISVPKHNPYIRSVYVEKIIEFLDKEGVKLG